MIVGTVTAARRGWTLFCKLAHPASLVCLRIPRLQCCILSPLSFRPSGLCLWFVRGQSF